MKNTQNVTIVLLIVTASVLTTLLLASYLYTQPAYGAIGSVKGGDYILSSGSYNAETDFIYIIDIASNKLNIYFPNINTNALTLGDSVDLARSFGAKQP